MMQAALADAQAAAELRNDVLISVVADVVRGYIDVRSLQLRLEIARENADTQTRTANLVRIRFQRGLTNELDVALAERQLARTLSLLRRRCKRAWSWQNAASRSCSGCILKALR